jgi:hypothetical protein
LVVALAILVPRGEVAGGEGPSPRVSDLRLRLDGERVLLSFKLIHAFDENLRKRIDSGIPTGFDFKFQLVRDRKTWFDTDVDRSRLRVDAMYNAVTREYLINFRQDGDLIESRVVREADSLEAALTEFKDFAVFTVGSKQASLRLRVRLRAELGTEQIFFFIPKKVTTFWVETRRFQMSSSED